MSWLRTHWKLFAAAVIAFFAIWAAARQKALAHKWQDKATDIELGAVIKGIETAEAANTQAKVHEARAEEIKVKAEIKVGERDEATADILARWGT